MSRGHVVALLLSLASLALAVALELFYLRTLGHLGAGDPLTAPVLAGTAVSLFAAGTAWSVLFVRAVGTVAPRLSGEPLRHHWMRLPRRLSIWQGALWLSAGGACTSFVAASGGDPELLAHLVVAVTSMPALIGGMGTFFVLEELAREAITTALPGGQLRKLRASLRTRILGIVVMFSVVPITALALAFEHAVDEHEAALARMGVLGAQHQADEGHGSLWVLAAAAAAMGVLLATFAARSISAPVAALTAAMERVRAGQLDARVAMVSEDELGRAAETFNGMVQGLSERVWLQETFGRYVSREVADALRANQISLAGEVRRVSLLFADIRGFTAMAEAMAPAALLSFINSYMDAMIDAVAEHKGRVDKVMGDGLMVVFGAPLTDPDHARNAIRAALGMRRALAALNVRRAELGEPPLQIGIGVHSGDVVAGNVGCSTHKLEYTVLGDAVNVASRVEAMTKEVGADILITDEAAREAGGEFKLTAVQEVRLRGRNRPVQTFTISDG